MQLRKMARFQITLATRRARDEKSLLVHPGKLWRLKTILGALVLASFVVGLFVAALTLGSIIAVLVLILLLIVFFVVIVKSLFSKGH